MGCFLRRDAIIWEVVMEEDANAATLCCASIKSRITATSSSPICCRFANAMATAHGSSPRFQEIKADLFSPISPISTGKV